ncbi:hypothetical protein CRG98_042702 [Punica granatum]|uniref:Uncharacterized protein n=1 Tax=Punica granatum TaxID=22663 RepID=A0A2I0HYZ0_PUNGR|nr:hypothetical protein CRG98_042702 [Punica granatum]
MESNLDQANKVPNVIPCLGIRGKSRGSVRESGDSVERLEGCSGAKDARSGKDGRMGGRQARGQAHGRAAVRGAVRGALRAAVRKRTGSCGYGCTVHSRARPSPEIT